MQNKICNICKIEQPKDNFYFNGNNFYRTCKPCFKKKLQDLNEKKKAEKCGSDKVLYYPNKYADEYQRECTFQLMELLGYEYNQENGIWFKEPWKTKDGEFPNIKKYKIKNFYSTKEIDRKYIDQMVELEKKGLNRSQIAFKLGFSQPTITKYLLKYGKKSNKNSGGGNTK
jgi:hypothetical protein